jgi:uncharacterized protein YqgV (UPF0045/DUF77 family)
MLAIESGLSMMGIEPVVRIDPHLNNPLKLICLMDPHVVIIERNGGAEQLVRGILEQHIPVIHLDEAQSSMTVMTQDLAPQIAISKLVSLIEEIIEEKIHFPESALRTRRVRRAVAITPYRSGMRSKRNLNRIVLEEKGDSKMKTKQLLDQRRVLVELSVIPLNGNGHSRELVAEMVSQVEKTGLIYEQVRNSLCLEGFWKDICPFIYACYERVQEKYPQGFLKLSVR